jgi:hypothetical protein
MSSETRASGSDLGSILKRLQVKVDSTLFAPRACGITYSPTVRNDGLAISRRSRNDFAAAGCKSAKRKEAASAAALSLEQAFPLYVRHCIDRRQHIKITAEVFQQRNVFVRTTCLEHQCIARIERVKRTEDQIVLIGTEGVSVVGSAR